MIEWAVHMRRFPQQNLMSAVAAESALPAGLCRDLADAVLAFHVKAEPAIGELIRPRSLRSIVAELQEALVRTWRCRRALWISRLSRPARRGGSRGRRPCSMRGRQRACVAAAMAISTSARLCCGRGGRCCSMRSSLTRGWRPSTRLHDLAFLLMDLDHCGQRLAANRVLNRYMARSQEPLDVPGLAWRCPIFLALRAGVRAMVSAQRAAQAAEADALWGRRDAAEVSGRSRGLLWRRFRPLPRCRGWTFRHGQVHRCGGAGAGSRGCAGRLYVRTDVERKLMFGVGETDRLDAETYTPEASARVYAAVLDKARGRAACRAFGCRRCRVRPRRRARERRTAGAVSAGCASTVFGWKHRPKS